MADQPDDYFPLPIYSQPGCKLDGTMLEGNNYVDNQWCRYQLRKGLPRKMGGYRRLTNELSGITRGMQIFSNNGTNIVHTGWSGGIEQFTLDMNGNVGGIVDRTPATFTANANTLWQFDTLYDGTAISTVLLACGPPNLSDISASTQVPVYAGDILLNTPLAPTTSPSVAGGVFALGPYAVSYDHDGVVNWSAVNDVNGTWTSARPSSTKLVQAMQIRAGAGNGPSGLIWGLDSLIRMTFVGGSTIWNFDTISPQYNILSSQTPIEYDGIYYWVGIDKFLMFNGVIQEVENAMNLNWFFDNLNYAAAQKCFTTKIPRWGEIWFCAPLFGATECNYAAILNVRLSRMVGYNVWYHTRLPNGGRSCAQYARVFRSPLFTGVDVDTTTSKYKLWQHEAPGVVDEIDGARVLAINSYFETNAICLALAAQGGDGNPSNASLYCDWIEPDFVQSGDMYVQIKGSRSNARAPDASSDVKTFTPQVDAGVTAPNQLVYLKEQRRQMRFRFGSNVTGGNYEMGSPIAQVRKADDRITS